jgi:predicted esterase YcpF (UPF0227 family)
MPDREGGIPGLLVYLHGFNSTPQSKKATMLRTYMDERGLGARYVCPALPHWPSEAIATVERELGRHPAAPVTYIGSSLGGFYATYLAEKHGHRAVLVNPACYPQRDLAKYLGPQQNLYSGERYALTDEHLRQLEALAVERPSPERYMLIVETGDEVLDYREAVERYVGAQQVVIRGGDHTLQSFPDHYARILAFAGLA